MTSPSGRLDHVTLLRATIARIERGGAVDVMPTTGGKPARLPAIALGPEGFWLDAALGGGLRRGALHEIAPAGARDEGVASRFAVALAVCGLKVHHAMVWIVDDGAVRESGAPYRLGLQGEGLDPDRLVVVRTRGGAQTLWAMEEALRGSALLVLAELWGGRDYGLAPSRRLVLAARARGATALLLHAGAGQHSLSTGCDTRLVVSAHPSRRLPAAFGGLPLPGAPAFTVRLTKARSAARGTDPNQPFPLHWHAAQRCFHDPDHPVAVAAAPVHRPARPPRRAAGFPPVGHPALT